MRRFGIIGRPLGHSRSAAYFTEKFNSEWVSDCVYAPYELESIDALPRLLADMPELEGFNVTIPYKREVIALLDDLTPEARAIGAVNCVRRVASDAFGGGAESESESGALEATRGRLIGYNTDIIGLRASLDKLLGWPPDSARQNSSDSMGLPPTPLRALVLGTGGASQAVQYALVEREIPYDLVSRDAARGNYTYDNLPLEVIKDSLLIINASPVGTSPAVDQAPRIPYGGITPRHYLLDLVYNPTLTAFLEQGRRRGAQTLNGEMMFIVQAEASWRIWNQ